MSDERLRLPDGFDRAERVAWGLDSVQLACVAVGALVAWWLYRLPLPGVVTAPLALAVGVVAAALGWGRAGGLPATAWAWRALRFVARPRTGGGGSPGPAAAPRALPPDEATAPGGAAAPGRRAAGAAGVEAWARPVEAAAAAHPVAVGAARAAGVTAATPACPGDDGAGWSPEPGAPPALPGRDAPAWLRWLEPAGPTPLPTGRADAAVRTVAVSGEALVPGLLPALAAALAAGAGGVLVPAPTVLLPDGSRAGDGSAVVLLRAGEITTAACRVAVVPPGAVPPPRVDVVAVAGSPSAVRRGAVAVGRDADGTVAAHALAVAVATALVTAGPWP